MIPVGVCCNEAVRKYLHFGRMWNRELCRESRGVSVGIATRYGLDGPEIESRWRRDFSHPSRQALGPNQPPTQWVTGLCRVKEAGMWR